MCFRKNILVSSDCNCKLIRSSTERQKYSISSDFHIYLFVNKLIFPNILGKYGMRDNNHKPTPT